MLTDTLTPVFLVNAEKTWLYAFFGTGSDAFEPNDTDAALDASGDRLRADAPDAVMP